MEQNNGAAEGVAVQLRVERATGLLNRDSGPDGVSDPFVTISLIPKGADSAPSQHAEPIFVSRFVSDSLDPVWKDAVLRWSGSTSTARGFMVSIYDKDPVGAEFLGQAPLTLDEMAANPTGRAVLKLLPRPNETHEVVRKNKDNLGTIEVSWLPLSVIASKAADLLTVDDHRGVHLTPGCVLRVCVRSIADSSAFRSTPDPVTHLPVVHLARGSPADGVPFHQCVSSGEELTPLLEACAGQCLGPGNCNPATVLYFRPLAHEGTGGDAILSSLVTAAIAAVGPKKGIRVSVEQYFANQVRDLLPKPGATPAAPSDASPPNEVSIKTADRWPSVFAMAAKRAALNFGHTIVTIRPDGEASTSTRAITFVDVAAPEPIPAAADAMNRATGAKMTPQEYAKFSLQQKYVNTSVHSLFQALGSIDALKSFHGKYWWGSCPFTRAFESLVNQGKSQHSLLALLCLLPDSNTNARTNRCITALNYIAGLPVVLDPSKTSVIQSASGAAAPAARSISSALPFGPDADPSAVLAHVKDYVALLESRVDALTEECDMLHSLRACSLDGDSASLRTQMLDLKAANDVLRHQNLVQAQQWAQTDIPVIIQTRRPTAAASGAPPDIQSGHKAETVVPPLETFVPPPSAGAEIPSVARHLPADHFFKETKGSAPPLILLEKVQREQPVVAAPFQAVERSQSVTAEALRRLESQTEAEKSKRKLQTSTASTSSSFSSLTVSSTTYEAGTFDPLSNLMMDTFVDEEEDLRTCHRHVILPWAINKRDQSYRRFVRKIHAATVELERRRELLAKRRAKRKRQTEQRQIGNPLTYMTFKPLRGVDGDDDDILFDRYSPQPVALLSDVGLFVDCLTRLAVRPWDGVGRMITAPTFPTRTAEDVLKLKREGGFGDTCDDDDDERQDESKGRIGGMWVNTHHVLGSTLNASLVDFPRVFDVAVTGKCVAGSTIAATATPSPGVAPIAELSASDARRSSVLDGGGDDKQVSIRSRARWYRVAPSESGTSEIITLVADSVMQYTLTQDDVGCTILFEFVPRHTATSRWGAAVVVRAPSIVLQSLPSVSGLRINIVSTDCESSIIGPSSCVVVGAELELSYDFHSGLEGPSTVQWFYSRDGRVYSLLAEGVAPAGRRLRVHGGVAHCYIRCAVQPIRFSDGELGDIATSRTLYVQESATQSSALAKTLATGDVAFSGTCRRSADIPETPGSLRVTRSSISFVETSASASALPDGNSFHSLWKGGRILLTIAGDRRFHIELCNGDHRAWDFTAATNADLDFALMAVEMFQICASRPELEDWLVGSRSNLANTSGTDPHATEHALARIAAVQEAGNRLPHRRAGCSSVGVLGSLIIAAMQ
jgi:hypothetical protein